MAERSEKERRGARSLSICIDPHRYPPGHCNLCGRKSNVSASRFAGIGRNICEPCFELCIDKEGVIAVPITHDDSDWAFNSREYHWGAFGDNKGHSFFARKGPDRTLEVVAFFPNFRHVYSGPIPSPNAGLVVIALAWNTETVTLYVNGRWFGSEDRTRGVEDQGVKHSGLARLWTRTVAFVAAACTPKHKRLGRLCPWCGDLGWVCENHRNRPWAQLSNRADACECGRGAPCELCNAGTPPEARWDHPYPVEKWDTPNAGIWRPG